MRALQDCLSRLEACIITGPCRKPHLGLEDGSRFPGRLSAGDPGRNFRLKAEGSLPPPRTPQAPGKRSIHRASPDAAELARAVPHLAPETLHALVRHQGLDASGDLVAAATPEQLTAVFDIDLWRPSHSGRDEQFDADRFGEWVEALVESDELLAARTIAALDEDLVITGLSRYLRVFDPAALLTPIPDDEAMDFDVPSFTGPAREMGGYVVRARRTDAWDAIVTLLFALAEHHPDRFHGVMRGCRRLSNSTPEIDGLDDLLIEPEQILHDAAAERDRRRSRQGYVAAADARAFLQMARQRRNRTSAAGSINPIVAASFRAAGDDATASRHGSAKTGREDGGVERGRPRVARSCHCAARRRGPPDRAAKGLLPAQTTKCPRRPRIEALLRHTADDRRRRVRRTQP